MNYTKSLLLIIASIWMFSWEENEKPETYYDKFHPGEIWNDNNGVHINAHGGGVMAHKDTYYWYGEHKIEGTLDLEKIVDPDILGGFILEVDFVRWDASLSGQLNSIKKQYIERNRRIV